MEAKTFIRDKEVARRTGMSTSWVRGQRHKRRHGLVHQLTVDPVMVGSQPLWACDEIEAWMETLCRR